MANEKLLILLEKQILGKMLQIKTKKITPQESEIGVLINKLKPLDEVLHAEIMEKYKEVLKNLKDS